MSSESKQQIAALRKAIDRSQQALNESERALGQLKSVIDSSQQKKQRVKRK